ncbi:unnamed protein product [Adineta steineri]|uniref:Uncharacterized protein n=1 Tax=Adineta steineri TaxID=433720 RepID=A0A818YL02_9BILA|nr:unnamed protein product [Adineta steineri]CAF1043791.1 unnamed protein product [Adineta steineri]CAF3745988.1 unnamed protein product [Adineta steineri]CAF3752370.1 unnamed protein product [Adineta steineri]
MMLRILFFGIIVFSCIIQIQDAMFTNGQSVHEYIDATMQKLMAKASKKLQNKLDVLKDSKVAIKLWKIYKKYYHKNYTTAGEEKERLGKFIDNLKLIIQANTNFEKGLKSFNLQLNQYGDMNLEEFRAKLTGLNSDAQEENAPAEVHARARRFVFGSSKDKSDSSSTGEESFGKKMKKKIGKKIKQKIKEEIDKQLNPGKKQPGGSGYSSGGAYSPGGSFPSGGSFSSGIFNQPGSRKNPTTRATSRLSKGAVDYREYMQPIENQGRCGSCYAFAVTAAIEGTFKFKKNENIKLSKQQLVDCSPSSGCSGGTLGQTYNYIKERGGLASDTSYPYANAKTSCALKSLKVGAISGYGKTNNGDEEGMRQALSTYGPLAAAIHTTSDLQFYGPSKSGRPGSDILDIPSCSKQVDHAIAIVGYGTENGKDYWLVRNSWGTNWGLQGYFKIARNKNSMCGIATYGYYTLV